MKLCEVWHATRTCVHACVWWGVICTCTRIPKQTKCQQTNGPRPTHSGTEGWSEPCVQRANLTIFVIVIEQWKKEMKGDRQKKKREPRRERQEKDRDINEKEKASRATFLMVCLFKVGCVSAQVCVSGQRCLCVCYGSPETFPCVLSKRIHVCRQNASVSKDTNVLTAHMDARAFSVVFSARTKKHIQ